MNNRAAAAFDLAVVGAGLAGNAAAMFGRRRGLSVVMCGDTGESYFASGLFDLLGAHPSDAGHFLEDPWAGIAALQHDCPEHPYARMPLKLIEEAVAAWLDRLAVCGLPYRTRSGRNALVLTAAGTAKPTYGVPETMWPGVAALDEGRPCLVVGFAGMREFSAHQIAAVAARRWPRLTPVSLVFPDSRRGVDLSPEAMAMAMAREEVREQLARDLRQAAGDAAAVGLPAVLGREPGGRLWRDLTARTGKPIFEIATLPPSVPGLRLREALVERLRRDGVQLDLPGRALGVKMDGGGFSLTLATVLGEKTVTARALVLATGRFLAGGLAADRGRVTEPLLDLPVVQPADRRDWHRRRFFDPAGHLLNRCGLVTDDHFRPLGPGGGPVHPQLAAIGTILAGQDWARSKCGSGLAVTSAYAAVRHLADALGGAAAQRPSNLQGHGPQGRS